MNLPELYRKILLIRIFERKLDDLFKKGKVHGTAHFCIGQEYIPAVVSQYLTKDDLVTSTHRGHGHAIAKGLDIKKLLGEIIGKKSGYNGGKGGSQHVFSREHNFFANGITGGMIPIANGMSFANKYNAKKNIVVAYLGDGGMGEGYVLETLNLAVKLGSPLLFVCENNHYAMSTPVREAHSTPIGEKVKGFGMNYALIENNDYKMLDEIAKEFVERAREGIPHFIEVMTYRHTGHSKNDLNLYRDKEEEKYWLEKDVLEFIGEEIISAQLSSKEDLNLLENNLETEMDSITERILDSPDPDFEQNSIYA